MEGAREAGPVVLPGSGGPPTQAEAESVEVVSQTEQRGFSIPFRWEVALYLLLLALALLMRLWDLGSRAMHHDEGLHAAYSWYLASGRGYQHNPMMHGPFQFHANAFIFFLFGDNDFTARLSYVLFGTALVGQPWFLRRHLGQLGALVVALLLAFSPTMLYFSRFARNDILMAVWVLGLVILLWRYLDEQRPRYLYLFSGVLAFAFATKETVYLAALVLGFFLLLLSLEDLRLWLLGRRRLRDFAPPGTLLILLVTLTLPLWAALSGLLQHRLGIVLANPDWTKGPVGLPQGGAIYIAAALTTLLMGISALLGLLWNWRVWLVCAAIFYGIWVLLYTTMFTNPFGIVSGMWQGLGYWIAQQEVRRGGQPWYYYFVVGWVYEFLPFLLALIGVVWYSLRRSLFCSFLIFWAVLTFLLYTWAGEKMPWLLVNVSLPLILLGGKVLADLVPMVPWRQAWIRGALLGLPLVPLLTLFAYRLLFYQVPRPSMGAFLSLWGWLLLLFGLLALMLAFTWRVGRRGGMALVALGVIFVLLLLTVRAGWRVTYQNGDVPVETLVYTQTSPEIARIARDIDRIAESTGQKEKLKVTIDGADGFSWPWVWYLRHYTQVGYPDYSSAPLDSPPDAAVVLVHQNNYANAKAALGNGYTEVQQVYFRWWFPESYRDVTPTKFLQGLKDRKVWRRALDYWLYRKLDTPLGHIDAYLFYSDGLGAHVPRP